MARQLSTKENILGLLGCTVIDTHDIGNLLTKVAQDLQNGELEEAGIKLGVLGSIYDTVPGCAFFRSTQYNHAHYLGLRQAYEDRMKAQAEKSESGS